MAKDRPQRKIPSMGTGVLGVSNRAAPPMITRHGTVSPVMSYLAGLAPASRRPQRNALERIARFVTYGRGGYRDLEWHRLTYGHTIQIQTWLASNYKPGTARRMMAAVRRVLKECYRHGLMSRDDLERAIDLEPIRGRGIPPGRALDAREVEMLMSAAGDGPVAARNRAILALLYGCGLRSVEITRLLFRDLDQEEREVVVRGKGSKDRRVPIPDGAGVHLDNWVDYRGRRHGPLFCTARSIRRMTLQPISPDAVYRVVVDLVEAAGIERATPHDLRRTFITLLLDRGADAVIISRLAGHASVNTTTLYDRRSKAAGRETVNLLEWPASRQASLTKSD